MHLAKRYFLQFFYICKLVVFNLSNLQSVFLKSVGLSSIIIPFRISTLLLLLTLRLRLRLVRIHINRLLSLARSSWPSFRLFIQILKHFIKLIRLVIIIQDIKLLFLTINFIELL